MRTLKSKKKKQEKSQKKLQNDLNDPEFDFRKSLDTLKWQMSIYSDVCQVFQETHGGGTFFKSNNQSVNLGDVHLEC